MKKNILFSVCFVSMFMILASCGKKYPEQLKLIPKNSSSIVGFNLTALNDSLIKDNIQLDSLFKDLDNPVVSSSEMNNFKNCGIDFGKTIFIVSNQTHSVSKGTVVINHVLATLKDEKQLDSFFIKQGITETKKGKGFSYRLLDKNSAVSWENNTVMFTKYQIVEKEVVDTSINNLRTESLGKQTEYMVAEIEKAFNQKESESAASIEGFVALVKSSPHIFSWGSMDNIVAGYTAEMPFAAGLTEIFKGNYVATSFNFERGRVASHSTVYFNANMQALLNNYGTATADVSLIDKFPSANINAAFVANVNPKLLPALLNLSSTESVANLGLSQLKLTTNDLTAWMKGDVAVVFSDFNLGLPEGKKSFSLMDLTKLKPSYKLLVNITVADKAMLDKVVNNAGKYIDSCKAMLAEQHLQLQITDKNVFITNDTTLIPRYLTSTQSNIDKGTLKQFDGKAAAGFFDISKSIQGATITKSMPIADSIATASSNLFSRSIFTVSKFDGKVYKADSELQLNDNSKNSASLMLLLLSNSIKQFKNFSLDMEKNSLEEMKKMSPSDIEKMLKEN
jgi:hypothetical protein